MLQATETLKPQRRVTQSMRGRMLGTILGAAVGDALGAPVEFMSPQDIAARYKGPVRDMVGGGAYDWRCGEYTDDTAMMLCIAESLGDKKTCDLVDIAQRFVDWYKSNPKDIGNTTRKALSRISNGASWHDCGIRNPTNGSVMRCAPVSLVYFHDEEALVRFSVEISAITHDHAETKLSCVFINAMIVRLLIGAGKKDAYDYAVAITKDLDPVFVKKYLRSSYKPDPRKGLAVNTLLLATSSFLSASSFEEAVVKAVNLGGDSDTTGAVTGALAGAYFGVSGIPLRWSKKLNPKPADYFVRLGGTLCEMDVK